MTSVKKELRIVMRRSSPELVELEYPLYRKYQIQQHKDPPYKVNASINLLDTD